MEEAPSGVMAGVAAPGPQVASYPGAGMEPVERHRGRIPVEVLGDSHATDRRVGSQALV